MKPSHLSSLLFIGLSAVAGSASAVPVSTAISGPVNIDFSSSFSTAVYGKSNVDPASSEGCIAKGCYTEDGFSVGTVIDPTPNGSGAHLHRYGSSAALRSLAYHNDSTGIYVRANDLSAFSMTSFLVDTTDPLGENPYAGQATSYYEVLGFNSALNDDIASWDWTADPTYSGKRVAYDTFANAGTVYNVNLNEQFQNVSAVWIHYVGNALVPSPDSLDAWNMKIDNIQLNVPVTVPVPAAAYLFGTGLMGFLAAGKRRRSL